MKYIYIITLVVILIAVLGAFLLSQRRGNEFSELKVATTIFPLYDIARNVIGDRGEVIPLLPPGASPHTFELKPSDVARLQGVSVIFAIGHGLDDWVNDIVDIVPNAKIVIVDSGIPLLNTRGGGVDPHYWLSLQNASTISNTMANTIASIDLSQAEQYIVASDTFSTELNKVKNELSSKVDGIKNPNLIVFHDSWNYFANELGLNIVGVFESAPGREPSPQYLAKLQRTAQTKNILAVFSETQFSTSAIKPFINDLGLELFELDPLGGVSGRESFVDLMKYNIKVIYGALKQAN